jgi:hypothetical protein
VLDALLQVFSSILCAGRFIRSTTLSIHILSTTYLTVDMYSTLLIATSLLSASVLATSHGEDKSPWDGGAAPPFNNAPADNCCDANQGGYWGDWQGGNPNPGEVIVQVVSVSDANASLKFYPDNIVAAPGSIVQFQFHPKVSISEAVHKRPLILSEPHNN